MYCNNDVCLGQHMHRECVGKIPAMSYRTFKAA